MEQATEQQQTPVAVVTGAARGIGQATAWRFAEGGYDLALFDLDAAWLEETVAGIEQRGRRALCRAVDVCDSDAVKAAVADVVAEWGQIDVLVNNAGITKDGLLIRMSDEDWSQVLQINLTGTFLMTRAVAKHMMKKRRGAIVNVASIIGKMGNAGQANYAASKGGVIALTKTSAKELAPRNIRVNAVAPGFIRTKMTDQLSEEVQKKMLDAIPQARFGEPEDVANAIFFLAGDQAAYVNGQALNICGGMVT